jgi:hypothetical protein
MQTLRQILILILLIIANGQCLHKYLDNKEVVTRKCHIQNKKYKLEFLYTSDDIIDLNRNEFVYERRVYTYPFGKINDFDKPKWDLIESNYTQGAFFIRSNKYNQYLCASNKFEDIFHMRQIIYRHESIMSRKCEWFFDKVGSHKNVPASFTIRNVKYNKLLYATTFLYMSVNQKRSVFLWYNSNIKTLKDEFKWIVDCSKGSF